MSIPVNLPKHEHSKIDHPESIYCPIHYGVMQDPVITSCGHTFDRSSIQDWLLKKERCPLDQRPISRSELTPNRALKDTIQALFSAKIDLFQQKAKPTDVIVPADQIKQNDTLAQQMIRGACELEKNDKWVEAEKMYKLALQFTNKSEHYAFLPQLWAKVKRKEEAATGFFVLAELYFKESNPPAALKAMQKSLDLVNDRNVKEKYAKALLENNRKQEAAQVYLELAQQSLYHKDELTATQLCQEILAFYPGFIEAYKTLAALQKDQQEALRILVKGANEPSMPKVDRKNLCKLVKIKDPENQDIDIQLLKFKFKKNIEKIKLIEEMMQKLRMNISASNENWMSELEEEKAARLLEDDSHLSKDLQASISELNALKWVEKLTLDEFSKAIPFLVRMYMENCDTNESMIGKKALEMLESYKNNDNYSLEIIDCIINDYIYPHVKSTCYSIKSANTKQPWVSDANHARDLQAWNMEHRQRKQYLQQVLSLSLVSPWHSRIKKHLESNEETATFVKEITWRL